MRAGPGGLHRVELVVDGRIRAGQVLDLIYLRVERKDEVMAQQLELAAQRQRLFDLPVSLNRGLSQVYR